VLARRVPLLLVARDQGLGVAERVADVLGEILHWDAARRTQMLDEYRAEIALTQRWRAPAAGGGAGAAATGAATGAATVAAAQREP
jgi:hypothetical protein